MMSRAGLEKFTLLFVLAAALLSLAATPSQAGWGHHARCNDCYPSYVGVYRPAYGCSSCCDPCGRGSARYGAYGYSGYGYGYSGYISPSAASYCRGPYWVPSAPLYYGTPDYGYRNSYYGGSAGCCGGQVMSVAPAPAPAADSVLQGNPTPADAQPVPAPRDEPPLPPLPGDMTPAETAPVVPPAPAPAGEKSTRVPHNGTILTVQVPEDAKVYMNGQLTRTPGSYRQYISRGLQPGQRYTYEVEAVVNRDGQTVRDTQVVQVRAGQTARVAFAFDVEQATQLTQASAAVRTTLTLQVPTDAQVVLAGNSTGATGATRRYSTTGLAQGETWEGYRVVVTAERNGRSVTEERTIRLTGGESKVLTFAVEDMRVAAR